MDFSHPLTHLRTSQMTQVTCTRPVAKWTLDVTTSLSELCLLFPGNTLLPHDFLCFWNEPSMCRCVCFGRVRMWKGLQDMARNLEVILKVTGSCWSRSYFRKFIFHTSLFFAPIIYVISWSLPGLVFVIFHNFVEYRIVNDIVWKLV